MIPLAAVVLVLVPFTAERIDDARSAATTARTAVAAREIGGLIQALQQERLLALGYLGARSLDRSALIAQSQLVIDDAARLRADPAAAAPMAKAAPTLYALAGIRDRVSARTIDARAAYDAFREANTVLLNALRLSSPPGADAQGLAQLGALDALMRSNEEASSVGAILVAASADPEMGRTLLADAATADRQNLRRFRELVPAEASALVDTIENGQAGQRIRELRARVGQAREQGSPAEVSEALTAALSYTGLRRLAQDRIAREIATGAAARAGTAQVTAYGVALGAAALFIIVVGLGYAVSQSISRPLRRLTRAAVVVAELSSAELVRVSDSDSPDPAPPRLAAVEVGGPDEIVELAAALNRVQATAALMLERQVTSRHNIAVMFANIARRTQTLVGRQLNLIDDLERNERDADLLQRLYGLDHVATRLRRTADSLLVVSGTIDQEMSGTPTPLQDVVRSALAEIEGFHAVQIGEIADVAIASSLVADLRLLLAELLENATNFSPPGAPVVIFAALAGECRIAVVDHGLGMGQARLNEENQRLVERERLDVAPTSVLGLFVVGRLARRHGLAVRLDHSEGRGITATVAVPSHLLSPANSHPPGPANVVAAQTVMPATVPPRSIEPISDRPSTPFAWFKPPRELTAVAVARSAGTPDTRVEQWKSPPIPVGRASVSNVDPASRPLPRRPVPARANVDEPAKTTVDPPARANVEQTAATTTTRSGLTRRVPGTHMVAPMLKPRDDEPTARVVRDPEAERDMLNDYLSGLARGEAEPDGSTLAERRS